jgi:transcriptional regulator with XRE-family HTH domain
MSYHRYKHKDFHFADRVLMLRKRADLTQEEVALRIGVTTRAIRNWEGGSNYPEDAHLRKLIELYLAHQVFLPGREQDEARALWDQLRESSDQRRSVFDEWWFTALLTQKQIRS